MISEDIGAGFSLFFCLSWITLLVGYIPMFLAFLKLRKVDAKKERERAIIESKPLITISKGSKEAAVKASLIPEAYVDCDFDIKKIREA